MKTTDELLLGGIDTVIIRVSDIDRAKEWYQHKLGLEPVWLDEQLKLAVMDSKGPTSLTLWQTSNKKDVEPENTSYPIFRTPNAAALKEQLEQRAIRSDELIEDHHVKYFRFFDLDGNMLEACEVKV